MYKEVFLYWLFSLIFIVGSIYNFRIGKESLYRTKLTNLRLVIILIVPMVFFGIAYFAGNGRLVNYILVALGAIFAISPIFGEGMGERGIYRFGFGGRTSFVRLTKWKDIETFKLDKKRGKLEMIKTRKRTIFPSQHYNLKDINEISHYIEKKIK